MGQNLYNVGFGNDFLDTTSNAQASKKKIVGKLDFMKIKTFVYQKTLSTKQKGNPQNGRKYLQIIYLIRN